MDLCIEIRVYDVSLVQHWIMWRLWFILVTVGFSARVSRICTYLVAPLGTYLGLVLLGYSQVTRPWSLDRSEWQVLYSGPVECRVSCVELGRTCRSHENTSWKGHGVQGGVPSSRPPPTAEGGEGSGGKGKEVEEGEKGKKTRQVVWRRGSPLASSPDQVCPPRDIHLSNACNIRL